MKSVGSVKVRVNSSRINRRGVNFNLHFHLKTRKEASSRGFVSISPTSPSSPSPSCSVTSLNGAGDDVIESNSNRPLSDNEGKNSEKLNVVHDAATRESCDTATQTIGPLNYEDQSTLVEPPPDRLDGHESTESARSESESHRHSQLTVSRVSPSTGHSFPHSHPLPFGIDGISDKSVPILEMSVKELIAILLLTCQNKRNPNINKYTYLWRLELLEGKMSPTGEQYYQLFFNGRLLFGINLIRLNGEFKHPKKKICAYGCTKDGTNQWIFCPVFVSLFRNLILV